MTLAAAEPLVSIVIPVFNGERHLVACIRSVLDQTYGNIEVVIADGASTDRSAEIIGSFVDPRVHHLPSVTEQMTLHANWARGLAAARGEFVKIVCQDDLLLPDCLAVQTELLIQHPTAVLACGRRRIIDDHSRVLIRARGLGHLTRTRDTRLIAGVQLVRACIRTGTNLLGEPVNVLIRRSALPEPLFDPRWHYTIDIEFYVRCLGERDGVVDSRVQSCFRVSPRQLSAALAASQAREMRAFIWEMTRRYPHDVRPVDARIGTARSWLLAQARRVLYGQMRMSALVADWRGSARSARGVRP